MPKDLRSCSGADFLSSKRKIYSFSPCTADKGMDLKRETERLFISVEWD
jgi:hypothetical protein